MLSSLMERHHAAGVRCDRCGGQAFEEPSAVPVPWRDYREVTCIQCGHVVETRWREPAPVEIEAPRRGRKPKGAA